MTNDNEANPLDVYHIVRSWASQRLGSFPLWDFDDIAHEAFVVALKMISKYDSNKGTLSQFLWGRLWCPLFAKYAKLNGLRIDRKKYIDEEGKTRWSTREIVRIEFRSGSDKGGKELTPYSSIDEHQPEFNLAWLSDTSLALYQLIGRGHSQSSCAKALGISESAVSQKMRVLRRDLRNVSD